MTRYFGLEPGRYLVDQYGDAFLQKSRSNKGWVVEGIALKYFNVFEDNGEFKTVVPGAFEISMRDMPVEFWIAHDSKLVLKGCPVELFSDDESLSFRVHLADTEICNHIRDLIDVGLYTEMSAKWHSSKTVTKNIDGKYVKFIVQGVLEEISLVPAGRLKTNHAQISELKNCLSLREDVESKKFRYDNSFAELKRTLGRLT